MKREYALVILAAGMGSRFGGIKQLQPVGPAGELIIDYSIYDAIEAGFRKIVFIIRREIEGEFRAAIGSRIESVCRGHGVEVAYAFQAREDLPGGYVCPPGREKPWGTGHALLSCRGLLNAPFVVLNADDYYGKSAFRQCLDYLKGLPENAVGSYCVAGFHLGNTVSAYGAVTRGICRTDENGFLRSVEETRGIVKSDAGCALEADGRVLDPESWVSMNMWGFTPDILPMLERQFVEFLAEKGREPKSEFLLPECVDRMLQQGMARVRVLPTQDRWFGMTYRQDVPTVVEAFCQMAEQGLYRPGLYE